MREIYNDDYIIYDGEYPWNPPSCGLLLRREGVLLSKPVGVKFPITQVKSIRVDMEKWPDGLEWEKERN